MRSTLPGLNINVNIYQRLNQTFKSMKKTCEFALQLKRCRKSFKKDEATKRISLCGFTQYINQHLLPAN
jgi:hypothetical protein